jgi:hypothetical protein
MVTSINNNFCVRQLYVEFFSLKITSYNFFFLLVIFSCGVWAIMLTTNLHENYSPIKAVRLEDFGFSFWINIGASGAYFYAFFIYLIAIFRNC